MTLRRHTPMRRSRGTEIPASVRNYVKARDNYTCVMVHLMPGHQCYGGIELDHVRSSGGVGMKSPSEAWNLVSLCSSGHAFKTENGRLVRPLLIQYLQNVERHEVN